MKLTGYTNGSVQIRPTEGEVPEFFEVTYHITASTAVHSVECYSDLHISIPYQCVGESSDRVPYLKVENLTAQRLPEVLRSLADQIEARNAEEL